MQTQERLEMRTKFWSEKLKRKDKSVDWNTRNIMMMEEE
jgi:hypothetical protein